jgi:hypothetical protein
MPFALFVLFLFSFQQPLNLRDFGAAGDDVADDSPALQRALDELASPTGASTKLIIPSGTYRLSTAVARDFIGLRSDVVIEGAGSGAVFHLASGTGTTNLSLKSLSSVTLRNLIFVGTPGQPTDAKVGLDLDGNIRTIVENVTFYGVSTIEEGGAVMRVAQTDFSARNLYFEGSNGYGFKQVPVLLIEQWAGVDVQNFRFIDYGVLNGVYHSKNAVAAEAWIKLLNPYGQSPSQGVAMFRNGFMDEGALVGILSRQTSGDAVVTVNGLGCNISNTELGQGVAFEGAQVAKVSHSKFGFSSVANRTIVNFRNVGRAEIDGVRGTEQARNVVADAATTSLRIKNSSFAFLSSAAKTTTILDSDIGTQVVSGKLSGADPLISSITGMPPVTGITGHPTNGGGGSTRTYWVVAVDAQGRRSRLSAPFVMQNAWGIGKLHSPSNFVHNLSWLPVPGAVSYDVLRDSTDRKVTTVSTTQCQDRTEATVSYNTPEGNESAVYLMDGVPVATTASPSWSTPTLKNGWTVFGAGYQNPQYTRHNGLVYLRGRVKGGVALSAITTLPAGTCPLAKLSFGAVEVLPDCSILHVTGATSAVSLDGIVFATN